MRSDLLPESYCLELLKLRSKVQPMSFEGVLEEINPEINFTEIVSEHLLGKTKDYVKPI